MSATLLPLHTPGVSVFATLTEDDSEAATEDPRRATVVRFDPKRPRLPACPPDGFTYREALPEIDRRAKEAGSDDEWHRLGVVYAELRALTLADNQKFREDWLTGHLWQAHTDYWGTRQKAAYLAGFAAGERVLRGELGPRLMDHSQAPPSAESWEAK